MKPRLEPYAQTDEDQLAWLDVAMRTGRNGSTLWTRSLMQDARDADLMFKFLVTRADASYVMWATYGLPYPDIEAIVSEWIG